MTEPLVPADLWTAVQPPPPEPPKPKGGRPRVPDPPALGGILFVRGPAAAGRASLARSAAAAGRRAGGGCGTGRTQASRSGCSGSSWTAGTREVHPVLQAEYTLGYREDKPLRCPQPPAPGYEREAALAAD